MEDSIRLTGEAHDRLLSHQVEGEELHETLERLMCVLPMHPDKPLTEDSEFALVRSSVEGGGNRTDEYEDAYAVYSSVLGAIEG